MNTIKELKRIRQYTNKNEYLLKQPFIHNIEYNKEVCISIYSKSDLPVRYLPTVVNARSVNIKVVPDYFIFDKLRFSNTYINAISLVNDPYLTKIAQILNGESVIKSH